MVAFGRRCGVLGVMALAIAGCAAPAIPAPAADWARAPVVRIVLSVGFFHPGTLTLRVRQPVRLVFQNGGSRTHDFVTNLFTAVAQRPGMRRGGVRVILQVEDTVEYDIVPEKRGAYSLQTVMFERPGAVPVVPIYIK